MAGCNRSAENPEAVRTAILEYLANQKGLNVAAMQVDVTALPSVKTKPMPPCRSIPKALRAAPA